MGSIAIRLVSVITVISKKRDKVKITISVSTVNTAKCALACAKAHICRHGSKFITLCVRDRYEVV